MLHACWSVKGGSGATVVAAGLALTLGSRSPGGVLLVDLGGDAPAALGLSATGPGVADWFAAGPDVPPDALGRLEIEVRPGVSLLPLGSVPVGAEHASRVPALLDELRARSTAVVIDAGRVDLDPVARDVAGAGESSLLVLRPCYLALRRAMHVAVRPSGIVLMDEPARALAARDIEDALDSPIVAVVPQRPEIARAVDAGMLSGRLPRSLAGALRRAA